MGRTSLFRAFSLPLCLALAACGGADHIRPDDRAAIHTARVVPPKKGVQGNVYTDVTSNAIRGASTVFGLAGVLVGGTIAAANTSAGNHRWHLVTQNLPEHVMASLRQELEHQFAARHGLTFPPAGPVDAELKLLRVTYGVEHLGHQEFGAVVALDVNMNRLTGRKGFVWSSFGQVTVPLRATLEECQRNPRLYVTALDEAIRQLVEKTVTEY